MEAEMVCFLSNTSSYTLSMVCPGYWTKWSSDSHSGSNPRPLCSALLILKNIPGSFLETCTLYNSDSTFSLPWKSRTDPNAHHCSFRTIIGRVGYHRTLRVVCSILHTF